MFPLRNKNNYTIISLKIPLYQELSIKQSQFSLFVFNKLKLNKENTL